MKTYYLIALVVSCYISSLLGFAISTRTLLSSVNHRSKAEYIALSGAKRPFNFEGKGSERKIKDPESQHSLILKQKVGRMLRDELTDIICSCDIKANVYPDESLLRGVTISDIEFASDLSSAKIYLSVLGNSVEKRQVYVWLCNNVGQVRYSLAQRLRELRRLPEIRFALADTQSAQYLNKVLDELSLESSGSFDSSESFIDFEEDG